MPSMLSQNITGNLVSANQLSVDVNTTDVSIIFDCPSGTLLSVGSVMCCTGLISWYGGNRYGSVCNRNNDQDTQRE